MDFASDNCSGVHPAILDGIVTEARRTGAAYGNSETDKAVRELFCEVFERDVEVFLVSTGTAANALALGSFATPGGIVLTHRHAHIVVDECGAPGYLSDGMRFIELTGPTAKIDPSSLASAIDANSPATLQRGRLCGLSLTQATEAGTVYSLPAVKELVSLASRNGLRVHMDGARLANAIASLGISPAQATWQSGVDILSFGATKNGCMNAEAIVVFDESLKETLGYRIKRSGHLVSKARFSAAQFQSYFQGGLWLELAVHANQAADRLRSGIQASTLARLAWETDVNEVFAYVRTESLALLERNGAMFFPWRVPEGHSERPMENETLVRLVTSYSTSDAQVDQLVSFLE